MGIRRRVMSVSALLGMFPGIVLAQPVPGPTQREIADRLHAGDTVFVTNRNGDQTRGRVSRVGSEHLSLMVDDAERTIAVSDIGRVEKRDGLWNGILFGAVPAAFAGAAGAGASCSPQCNRDVPITALAIGAIGAGIGAVIDVSLRGYSVVAGPPLRSASAWRDSRPVTRLDAIWTRIRHGETIAVVLTTGNRVTGRFMKASSGSLTLDVKGASIELQSTTIRHVTRTGNRHRAGMVWGGLVAATLGGTASAACTGEGCGNPLGVALWMGSAGAMWGTAIGVLLPKHPRAYEADASVIRVAPVVGSGRVGLSVSAAF